MTFDVFVMQAFSGISLFTILVLMALGLAIIFGLMGVINMAHGEIMALGAYVTYLTASAFEKYLPSLMGIYVFFAITFAFLATFAFGWLLERSFIRFLYNRPLDTLLATWGLSLVLQQIYRSVFGAQEVSVSMTSWLDGAWGAGLGDSVASKPFVHCGPDTLGIRCPVPCTLPTRWGLNVRAVTQNRR